MTAPSAPPDWPPIATPGGLPTHKALRVHLVCTSYGHVSRADFFNGSRAECLIDDHPHAEATPDAHTGLTQGGARMRTPRRPLAFAATITSAVLGIGLLAGVTPAAAAAPDTTAAVTDCGSSSVQADGMIDVDLLQSCLDQVQASLAYQPSEEAAPAEEAPAVETP